MLIPIIRVSLFLLKIPMHATIIYLGSQPLFENNHVFYLWEIHK